MSTTVGTPDPGLARILAQLPSADELPSEDGVPMETAWHRTAMNVLIETLQYHWQDRNDYFVGGNMFIYYSLDQVQNRDIRGPDFFCVKNVSPNRSREKWVVWLEDGRYPNVIIELLSESTAAVDRGEKKDIYATVFRTPEYFCFDPADGGIEAWRLGDEEYEPVKEKNGRFWSKQLGLYLGAWKGSVEKHDAIWPRFFTRYGELVPTYAERNRTEKQRADAAEAELARVKAELEALKQSKRIK